MNTYHVQHNFSVSQPAWKGDYVRRFGAHNEGFTIEAETLEQAKQILKSPQYNLNPFYVKITPQKA